jgi:hypothetical protein
MVAVRYNDWFGIGKKWVAITYDNTWFAIQYQPTNDLREIQIKGFILRSI